MGKYMRKLIIPLLLVFLLFGCIKNVAGPSTYGSEYANRIDKFAIYDPALIEECKLGECLCFTCKNETSYFGFVKSLVGGSCRFIDNCTTSDFMALANQSDKEFENEGPWPFMVGQGYSFSDFGDANPWCGNRLDMAVHWLVGTNETPYSMPDADRSTCMLNKEIIPVYVLYSGGKNVDHDAAFEIANRLSKVGPVIITTEIDFDSSDSEVIENITKQIDAINSGCGNSRPGDVKCMVALAPKMGDKDALEIILNDRDYKDKVDLVAFGINAHTVNLSDRKKPLCDADDVYTRALEFAKLSLYNYSKPTVIPYILFDSKGTDLSGTCTWLEKELIDGYSSFFPLQMPHFKKAGVIGAAPYDFNSSLLSPTNPLGCFDCALGANDNRMRAWFASCRKYKTLEGKYNAGDIYIRFANESGGYCDYGSNLASILKYSFGTSFNYKTPALSDPNETYFRCDACVNENLTFPFDVPLKRIVTSKEKNETYCESIPAIEVYASKRNLDPMLVRALIYHETSGTFNNCSAAEVSLKGKLDPGCYPKGYDRVPDPDEVCNQATPKAGIRYCAIGLMQTLVPPYTFWPMKYQPDDKEVDGEFFSGFDSGEQLYEEARAAGRSGEGAIPFIIAECSPYFNPYNATHSVCYGTKHLSNNLDTAMKKVSANKVTLGADDANKERVLSYYLALNYYRGYGNSIDDWIKNFSTQKSFTVVKCSDPVYQGSPQCIDRVFKPNCYGQTDFIKYVRECWFDTLGKPSTLGDYASSILGEYQDLVNSCAKASCPSWKRLAAACKEPPSSWPPPEGEKCELIKS
jgi:hypothetical protein